MNSNGRGKRPRSAGSLQRRQGGSSAAFESAVSPSFSAHIYGLCLRMTGQHHTLPRIASRRPSCRHGATCRASRSRSAFGTWLHRIAVNTVLQQARRRSEQLGTADSVEREVADVLA
jgi:DNA-directed RNA polymerase specialized sigma24 family protein